MDTEKVAEEKASHLMEKAEIVALDLVEQASLLAKVKLIEENKRPRGEKYVPFLVFTWAIGVILIVVGTLFTIQTQLSSRVDKLDVRLTTVLDGQGDIQDKLIRLDERQQVNIQNVLKILEKLNIQ